MYSFFVLFHFRIFPEYKSQTTQSVFQTSFTLQANRAENIEKKMAFELLKAAEKGGLKYKTFSELEIGEYPVKSFGLKKMTHGDCVIAYLEDGYVVLPDRFKQQVGQKSLIEELNTREYIMKFGGKGGTSRGFVDVSFEIKPSVERTNSDILEKID